MPGQMAAAHGACRSGGVFPQYSSLWSGVLPRVLENPDGAATRKYFPASRFRRSVTQWGSLNRRMNRFFSGATGLFPYVGGARQAPRCYDRPRTHLLVLLFNDGRLFFARRDVCGRRFVHGPGVFFHFPVAAGFAGASRFCCRLPCFSGGGSLASGQAVDDGRGPFLLWTSIPAAALLLHAAAILWRRRGEKEFARSGAGPQPRIFRFRIASVFAGCAGSFPFADGGAHLAVAGGQWAGDSSPGLVGRLLRGRFVESADVSTQAAGDVDRVCLRFFFSSFCWE